MMRKKIFKELIEANKTKYGYKSTYQCYELKNQTLIIFHIMDGKNTQNL